MSEKRQRRWERLERFLEERDKKTQECTAAGLCNWCCKRPAITQEGECKECSRLPGHAHEYEDERDDTIMTLRAQNRELREALEPFAKLADFNGWNITAPELSNVVFRANENVLTRGDFEAARKALEGAK